MTSAGAPTPIDLHFEGVPRSVGAWLLETDDGPAVVDCGPATTLDELQRGLAQRGVALADLRHLLITHIHFDHAGGAGALAAANPDLTVHVSEVGAPHLAAPERLERSARRLYGDEFDRLYGALTPVPEHQIRIAHGDVVGLDCFPALGHAKHHVAYLAPDGTLYSGDAAGVRIQPHATVWPVAPPPDIDVAGWLGTISTMRERDPERIAPTHFGLVTDPPAHLEHLEQRLLDWSERVSSGEPEATFTQSIIEDLVDRDGATARPAYEAAAPAFLSWLGLDRWRQLTPGP